MICGLSIIRGAIKAALSEQPPAPIVKTLNGTFLGIHSLFYDQDYFLGIPYAQPPVGPLRFSPPVPLNTSWEGTKTATEYGHICYSYGVSSTLVYYYQSLLRAEIVLTLMYDPGRRHAAEQSGI